MPTKLMWWDIVSSTMHTKSLSVYSFTHCISAYLACAKAGPLLALAMQLKGWLLMQ